MLMLMLMLMLCDVLATTHPLSRTLFLAIRRVNMQRKLALACDQVLTSGKIEARKATGAFRLLVYAATGTE